MGNADLPHCGRREPKSKGVYPPAKAGFIPSHDGKVVFKARVTPCLFLLKFAFKKEAVFLIYRRVPKRIFFVGGQIVRRLFPNFFFSVLAFILSAKSPKHSKMVIVLLT